MQNEQGDLQRKMIERQMPPPLEERQRFDALQFAVALATNNGDREWTVGEVVDAAQAFYEFVVNGGDGEDSQNPLDDRGANGLGLVLPTEDGN